MVLTALFDVLRVDVDFGHSARLGAPTVPAWVRGSLRRHGAGPSRLDGSSTQYPVASAGLLPCVRESADRPIVGGASPDGLVENRGV
jgi:hypothetical protein